MEKLSEQYFAYETVIEFTITRELAVIPPTTSICFVAAYVEGKVKAPQANKLVKLFSMLENIRLFSKQVIQNYLAQLVTG